MRLAISKLNVCALLAALLCLLVACVPASVLARRAAKCPEERELEMDNCASRMGFLGDHSFKVPKNLTAMTSYCTQLKDNIGCIQTYSRDCLGGFTKQILNSFLKRGRQQQSSICGTDTTKNEFITKMGTCLSDDKIPQFHQCMDASIARFEYISKQVVSENRLPALCCSYQIFFRDVEETIGRLCNGGTASGNRANGAPPSYTEVLKFIQKLVTGTTGEFIQLVCDNHRSLEECRASSKTRDLLKQLETITKQAKASKIKNKKKSLIPPLLEILDSGPA